MKRTEIAERTNGQDAPLLLKFRLNPKYIAEVAEILEVRKRSKEEEKGLTEKRVATVGEEFAFAYERIDAAGNKQGDTGTEMFYNDEDGTALNLSNIVKDLHMSHYNLYDVYCYQKQNDRMSFIVFCFNKGKADFFNTKIYILLKKLTEMSWEHVHIWDNPDNGKITINCAHIMQEKCPTEIRMARTNGRKEIESKRVEKVGVYFSIG